MGVGLCSLWAFSPPALARISPASPSPEVNSQETFDNFKDEDMKAAFERWKTKSYALTVPLRMVALEGSVPPSWMREFLRSQGTRVRFCPEFRRSLKEIFHELCNPFRKGKINPKSAVAADLVTLGDSWLNFAIGKGLIEPLNGAENQDWFQDFSDKWKVYFRRSTEGNLDSQGQIWAVPYRWGSMVIAYNKREFQKRKLAPIEDWSDLWRPELAGKISMVDSSREIVGAVLKRMGSSYNTTNIDSQVVGGKNAVLQQLELLVQQDNYLNIYKNVLCGLGNCNNKDTVDTFCLAERKLNGASSTSQICLDLLAVPAASTLVTDQIGGRVGGPSPLVQQLFCLQPSRALPFNEEIIPGASPISLKTTAEEPRERVKGRPKLDTNIIHNVPPAEILSKCEFLEPL